MDNEADTEFTTSGDDTEIVENDDDTEIVDNDHNTEIVDNDDNTEIVVNDDNTEIVDNDDNTEIVNNDDNTEIVDNDDNTEIVDNDDNTAIVDRDDSVEIADEGDYSDWKRSAKKVVHTANGYIKGSKAFHATQGSNYKIKLGGPGRTCKVNVINKVTKASVLRLDRAHKGTNFNHININRKVSGLPTDPHIPLPPGGLTAGKGVATFCKYANKVNKVAVPVAVAIDTVRVGVSIYEDVSNGTTRNTVETAASVAGGWGGGFGGAMGGAAIGSAILPGVGTIIGGIIGGLSGGIGGSLGASAAAEAIGDAVDYGVEEKLCKKCDRKFKVRKYKGEKYDLCPECANPSDGDQDAIKECIPAHKT